MIVTGPAQQDLAGIHSYIGADSPENADGFVRRLYHHMEKLAKIGSPGAPRDSVRRGLRLSVLGRYNIYFRATDEAMIVLHVIHSARDISKIQFDEPA